MLITLHGNQLTTKLAGQPAVPAFAESETKFFLKVVDAQLEFSSIAGDKAAQLTIHQNGQAIGGKRMDDAEAKPLFDAADAASKRFQDQKVDPRAEAALRKLIDGLRSGKPDYDAMSSGLAAATRQQLPQLQASVTRLGALQSLTFKGVANSGHDIFVAKFENGALEYRILLASDGKVESATVRPAQ